MHFGYQGKILAGYFVFLMTILEVAVCREPANPESVGRLKEFDEMLMMYGKEITEGKNLKHALEEARRLSDGSLVNKEFADYYIEMLQLIEDTGSSKVLIQERDRLNSIITSASYQPDGQVEINYALYRRNILDSFVDSASSFVMELVKKSPDDAVDRVLEMVGEESLGGGGEKKKKKKKKDKGRSVEEM